PVSGAEVVIRDGSGKVRWRGATGLDGVARTPGQGVLRPETLKRPAAGSPGHTEEGSEGEGEEFDEEASRQKTRAQRRQDALYTFVRVGPDLTWVNPYRTGGLAAWQFN